MEVLRGKIVGCKCGSFLKYDESDIKTEERGYGVGTYYGETYIAKIITCPICLRKIEVADECCTQNMINYWRNKL